MANLKIYINPVEQGALAEGYLSGKRSEESIIFDEFAQKIYLAGDAYEFKTLSAQEYTDLTAAIANLGNSSISDIEGDISGIQDDLGDLTDTGIELESGTAATVENLLKALETRLAAVEADYLTSKSGLTTSMSTEVTNAVSGAINALGGSATGGATGVTGAASHVKVTVTSQSGQVSSVTVNEDDIASASALASLSGTVATIQGSAVTEIVGVTGYTGTSISLDGDKLKVGTSAATGAVNTYADDKISDAIDKLDKAISAIAGSGDSSLASKIQLIDDIYDELHAADDGSGSTISTIIDALRALKLQTTAYKGIDTNGDAVTGSDSAALQTSLVNLANLIKNYKTANSLQNATEVSTSINNAINALGGSATGGADGVTGAASHVKVTVSSQSGQVSSVTVNEDDIASAAALAGLSGTVASIQSNAKSVVLSNTGATAGTNYIKVTESSNQYTVETTQALDNAINGVVSWSVVGA